MGTIRGAEATAVSISCPGYGGFAEIVEQECERFREIRGSAKSKDFPFDVFPDKAGLLPFGADECDVWLCWITTGNPNEWPIVVRWAWGTEGMRDFNMPLTEFLVNIIERKIELPCWPFRAYPSGQWRGQ